MLDHESLDPARNSSLLGALGRVPIEQEAYLSVKVHLENLYTWQPIKQVWIDFSNRYLPLPAGSGTAYENFEFRHFILAWSKNELLVPSNAVRYRGEPIRHETDKAAKLMWFRGYCLNILRNGESHCNQALEVEIEWHLMAIACWVLDFMRADKLLALVEEAKDRLKEMIDWIATQRKGDKTKYLPREVLERRDTDFCFKNSKKVQGTPKYSRLVPLPASYKAPHYATPQPISRPTKTKPVSPLPMFGTPAPPGTEAFQECHYFLPNDPIMYLIPPELVEALRIALAKLRKYHEDEQRWRLNEDIERDGGVNRGREDVGM